MMSDLTGFLVLDKPLRVTSMQAVAAVRRRAGGTKTGHAGTLDPLATGVLVIAIGRPATRLIDRIMATEKRYRTVIDLSAFTITDDREGERVEVVVQSPPSRERVECVLGGFVGEIMQRPPAFSAVKVGGKRAYRLARRGEAPDMAPRQVTIHSVELDRYGWPELEIEVRCAKGTYIRSLARDIGVALGTGGHCAMLRRTAVGPFDESMAIPLDAVPDPLDAPPLLPLEEMVRRLEKP